MSFGVIVEKKSTRNLIEVHWKINFFSLSPDDCFKSPIFKFCNASWNMIIDPSEVDNRDDVALHLCAVDISTMSCDMICSFCIKKAQGSFVGFRSFKHTFCDEKSQISFHHFFSRSELEQRRSELLLSEELTILCNLKQPTDSSKLTELNGLSEDIRHLYINEELWDIILNVKDKEFKAHKSILAARSSVFAAMLKYETSEKQSGIISIPDCDPESFKDFLDYLYSGKPEKISPQNVLHLYEIADKYNVENLKMFCTEHMEQNLEVESFFDVVFFAEKYEETQLYVVAQDFFNRNLKKIFKSAGWKTFMGNNFNLANKLLIEMTSDVRVVEKAAKVEVEVR